jgi:hypothetical protein
MKKMSIPVCKSPKFLQKKWKNSMRKALSKAKSKAKNSRMPKRSEKIWKSNK